MLERADQIAAREGDRAAIVFRFRRIARLRQRLVGAGRVAGLAAQQVQNRQRALRAGPMTLARFQQLAQRSVEIGASYAAPRLVRRPRQIAEGDVERPRLALQLAQGLHRIARRAQHGEHHCCRARRRYRDPAPPP